MAKQIQMCTISNAIMNTKIVNKVHFEKWCGMDWRLEYFNGLEFRYCTLTLQLKFFTCSLVFFLICCPSKWFPSFNFDSVRYDIALIPKVVKKIYHLYILIFLFYWIKVPHLHFKFYTLYLYFMLYDILLFQYLFCLHLPSIPYSPLLRSSKSMTCMTHPHPNSNNNNTVILHITIVHFLICLVFF